MRIFASPSRYIQGENALFENAKQILKSRNISHVMDSMFLELHLMEKPPIMRLIE